MISVGSNTTKIRITEFDEDWFPFQFDIVKNPYAIEGLVGENKEQEEDDADGASDTWGQLDDRKLEEVEINTHNQPYEPPLQDKKQAVEENNITMEIELETNVPPEDNQQFSENNIGMEEGER
ncbi:unnamed protein product [Lactuca virosa]|uniref:Uncharacterized protein n=1 Tax=Lactuca virosa TaxID=75947 RepID=A0AAU9N967_9ASTR|nr:unnamed protein product [Lactuca virosa]